MASEKKASIIGNVHYHPFLKTATEPFGLYVKGNPTFKKYDYVPLTIFQLTQRTISTAANSFDVPVWFTFCIDEDGTYLPFCSTISGYLDNYEVPVILNGRLLRESAEVEPYTQVWPAIIHRPEPDDKFIIERALIRYERGAVISAFDVYGF